MTPVRKPARSLETALDIVETGIRKIVTNLRATAPEERRHGRRAHRAKGLERPSATPATNTP
jgi:hypothetical protein